MVRSVFRQALQFVGSMRFAVALLVLVGLLSIVGTCIEQRQAYTNYVEQFGQFWAKLFDYLGLYTLYESVGFCVLLSVLLLALLLCCVRRGVLLYRRCSNGQKCGFSCHQETAFFLIHGAFLLIAVGAALDANLFFRIGNALLGDQHTAFLQPIRSIRGEMVLQQGKKVDQVTMRQAVTQAFSHETLPFQVSLDRFNVEYYKNGMPKRYESFLSFFSEHRQFLFSRLLAVNRPILMDGFRLYQKGFNGNGTELMFRVYPLDAYEDQTATVDLMVGAPKNRQILGRRFHFNIVQFEFNHFYRASDLPFEEQFDRRSDLSALESVNDLGPSMLLRLTSEGQRPVNIHQYLHPVRIEERTYYLCGFSFSVNEAYRYWRIPVIKSLSLERFFDIRRQMMSSSFHPKLAEKMASGLSRSKPLSFAEKAQFKLTVIDVLSAFSEKGLIGINVLADERMSDERQGEVRRLFIALLQEALSLLLNKEEAAWMSAEDFNQILFSFSESIQYQPVIFLAPTFYQPAYTSMIEVVRLPGIYWIYSGFFLFFAGFCLKFYDKFQHD